MVCKQQTFGTEVATNSKQTIGQCRSERRKPKIVVEYGNHAGIKIVKRVVYVVKNHAVFNAWLIFDYGFLNSN